MSNRDRATTASLRISRVVRVSRERAFAAWTQPDQIVRRLVYSWRLDVESNTSPAERVTVLFRGDRPNRGRGR